MTTVGAFVCTFRRMETLVETIRQLLTQTRPPDHVLIVDNAASARTEAGVRSVGDDRLTYHAMSENTGPAGAVAFGLAWLRDAGFHWILWGDDDDPPRTPDTLQRLVTLIEVEDAPDLAAVAAVGARWDWGRGETRRLHDGELDGPREVDVAGGGQQLLVRSSVLRDERLPDPRLFFALDDFDFCLRLRAAGYRIMVDGELMAEYRSLAGRTDLGVRPRARTSSRRTVPWRRYYATRNYIHLMLRTFGRTDLAIRETGKSLARGAASWSCGPRYGWQLTRAEFAGLRDGYLGRLGRTVEPSGYPPSGEPV